ncbi:MAG: preprotein translocase subunit SecE [Brevinema sp.]
MGNLVKFLKGSIDELRKVTWPTKDEVVRATIATVIFVVIFALILFGVDVAARIILQGLMNG